VLIGCGLRRGETAGLTIDQVQQREARWVLVDIQGREAAWAKAPDRWTASAAIREGRMFRAIAQRGEIGQA
jgi:hypothetical protein